MVATVSAHSEQLFHPSSTQSYWRRCSTHHRLTHYIIFVSLQALSFDFALTPWTTVGKSKPRKEHRRVRMEGASEGEEEKAEVAQQQTGEELTSNLSKNEIKRMRKAQRRKEVNL